MCQPSPLGRCSTDAKNAYETAELKLTDASRAEREDRFQLKTAHDNLQAVQAEVNKKFPNGKPAFGSNEDKALKAARKQVDKAINSWDSSKEKKVQAEQNVLIKRMHFDSSPAGQKELSENPDAEDARIRQGVVRTLSTWQEQVKSITDSEGNPITSKEGKASPEAREIYSNLYQKAKEDLHSKEARFKALTSKVAHEKKKCREYDDTDNPLLDAQENKTYEYVRQARNEELRMLMYKDRVDDLKKIIQKNYAHKKSLRPTGLGEYVNSQAEKESNQRLRELEIISVPK